MPVVRCTHCNCWQNPAVNGCAGCAYWGRRRAEVGDGHRCKHCAAPLPQDAPTRCTKCAAVRGDAEFQVRKAAADSRFPQGIRGALLDRLTTGEHITAAAAAFGVTSQQIHGFKAYDDTWADALDAALMAGRVDAGWHGTERGYRRCRCRCPECREARQARRLRY